MRKENSDFNTKFISEAGSYLINADYFAFVELKDYACYVVADGIDPDEKKESAKLAVTTVITEFSDAPGMSKGKLRRYLKAAHEALLRESDEIRLEASIVIMLTDYKKAIWGHAGNSRLYWIKNGEIKLVTKDTSLTQRMVDQEEVPIDQISAHAERNNLYTYLGQPGRFNPVISVKRKLEDGDIFILMTRGVWENIGDAELIDAVDGVSKAEDVCTGLEDVILSQRLDVIENYTIASVFINKIYKNPKAGRYKTFFRIGFAVFMALFGIIFSLCMVSYNKTKSNMNKMNKAKEAGIEKLLDMNMQSATEKFAEANDTAESMNARENSKAGKLIKMIERYNDMVEYVNYGREALGKGKFDVAEKQFGRAVDKMEELRESGEDVSSFENIILAYKTYTVKMNEGIRKGDKGENEEAKACFIEAQDVMKELGTNEATDLSEAATVMVSACEAQVYLQKGSEFEKSGDEKRAKGDLEGAIGDYASAEMLYQKAYEKDESAQIQLNVITAKLDNVSKQLENMSDEQRISKAKSFIEEGDKAAREGKKEEALKNYNQAMEQYSKVTDASSTNLSQLKADLTNKISNLDTDPSQELLSAIDCLSRQDYASAIEALNRAKELYNLRGDKSSVQLVQTYINNVKGLMNRPQE